MVDPFEKAERWRLRARQLRAMARATPEPEAETGLFAIADALEHHASSLEKLAVDMQCSAPVFRVDATETVPELAD